jgi:hypothetical protein
LPSLAQMLATVNQKSYYSRSVDEIYAALDEKGKYVYDMVCNENGGFFIKFDTTSVSFVSGTTEYSLPTDCTQVVHLAERLTSTDQWNPIDPASLNNVLLDQLTSSGLLSIEFGQASEFTYYGPYLDSSATTGVQTQKIRISPAPSDTRFVQLVYTAKWVQIVNDKSTLMLPNEGTYAQQNYAIAEMMRANGDAQSAEYELMGDKALRSFLTWVRSRQIQKPLGIEPFA